MFICHNSNQFLRPSNIACETSTALSRYLTNIKWQIKSTKESSRRIPSLTFQLSICEVADKKIGR